MDFSGSTRLSDDYLVSTLGFKNMTQNMRTYYTVLDEFIFGNVDFENYIVFARPNFIIARRKEETFYHFMLVVFMADENQYMQQVTRKEIQYLHQLQMVYLSIMGEEMI
jgi:hypothetical protein